MSSVQDLSLLMIECWYMTALKDFLPLPNEFLTYEISNCLPVKTTCHIDGIWMVFSSLCVHIWFVKPKSRVKLISPWLNLNVSSLLCVGVWTFRSFIDGKVSFPWSHLSGLSSSWLHLDFLNLFWSENSPSHLLNSYCLSPLWMCLWLLK